MTGSTAKHHRPNEVLRKHLEYLGWSISGFARRIGERCQAVGLPHTVSPSTVSRWCKGAVPSAELAAAACHVLSAALHRHVTPESLGWLSDTAEVAAQSLEYRDVAHAVRMLARLWALDAMRRRDVVKSAFSASVFGPASREALVMPADADIGGRGGPYKVTAADIDLIDEHTRIYGRLDAQHGGGKYRGVFASLMDTHATPMLSGTFSARTGRRLYGSVVDAVLAMASMAYDDQLPGLAQRYDLQAMRLAQAIGDRARITRVHIHQVRLAATQGGRADVLAHARSAVLAAEGTPPLVRAYACVTEARAWALNGKPDQVMTAVKRARAFFTRAQSSVGPAWLEWFDLRELEGQAAWAFAVAGLAEQGAQALKEASALPSDRTRDTVELLITEAELARLRGDSAEHAAVAKRASQASQHLMSRRLSERLDHLNAGEPLRGF